MSQEDRMKGSETNWPTNLDHLTTTKWSSRLTRATAGLVLTSGRTGRLSWWSTSSSQPSPSSCWLLRSAWSTAGVPAASWPWPTSSPWTSRTQSSCRPWPGTQSATPAPAPTAPTASSSWSTSLHRMRRRSPRSPGPPACPAPKMWSRSR